MLPLYWNSSTRHFLLHTFKFIKKLGHFWAFSMLGVERLHLTIKRLARSKKNIMKSIQKYNDVLIQSQLQWRYDDQHTWSFKSQKSSFKLKEAVPKQNQVVEPLGALRKREVNSKSFKYLQDAWTAENPAFREFRDQYYVTYLRNCKKQRTEPVPFCKWRVSQNTPEQKRYSNTLL
jgi:hypothetical protein